MQTISATELARHTREVLDRVAHGGEAVAVERNHALIVTISPAERAMTATQAMTDLPAPMLTVAQAKAWLNDSRDEFDETLRNPWE
jgi:antitoxin (DNA-binding transcriptional repressor) of toxin-antitoxin stability system